MLCLALSGLVEDKNITIKKQLMLHGEVWKAFCLEAVLHKQLFPPLLSAITVCIEPGEAKHKNSDFGPFGDDCQVCS